MDAEQELYAIFRAEVEEQIDDLATHLARKPDRWKVDRLFQISHNVKGAARLVGADQVRDASHALEDLFSVVRSGRPLDPPVVELARRGTELLESCFTALEGGEVREFSAGEDWGLSSPYAVVIRATEPIAISFLDGPPATSLMIPQGSESLP